VFCLLCRLTLGELVMANESSCDFYSFIFIHHYVIFIQVSLDIASGPFDCASGGILDCVIEPNRVNVAIEKLFVLFVLSPLIYGLSCIE